MKYRKVMDKRMVLDSIMRLCLKENDRSIDMYIADRKGNTYPITHVFLAKAEFYMQQTVLLWLPWKSWTIIP